MHTAEDGIIIQIISHTNSKSPNLGLYWPHQRHESIHWQSGLAKRRRTLYFLDTGIQGGRRPRPAYIIQDVISLYQSKHKFASTCQVGDINLGNLIVLFGRRSRQCCMIWPSLHSSWHRDPSRARKDYPHLAHICHSEFYENFIIAFTGVYRVHIMRNRTRDLPMSRRYIESRFPPK